MSENEHDREFLGVDVIGFRDTGVDKAGTC